MRRRWTQIAAVTMLAVATNPIAVSADLFTGFYTSSTPQPKPQLEPEVAKVTTGASCISAILAAQERYDIPDNLLLAIGIQEAGRNGPEGLAVWPWTVNAAGEGVFFQHRVEAEAFVSAKLTAGVKSIDIGCMQINHHWHGDQFPSTSAMFDPGRSADYAARFLRNLYRETGDWAKAAGRYHSATPKHQKRYLASLQRNQDVVRVQFPQLLALGNSVAEPVVLAEVARAPIVQPPVFWAQDDQSGASYSIYTTQPLQPVLPAFRNSP